MGLTKYYRRFIKGYGGIVGQLTRMLKNESFQLNEEAKVAFHKLKEAVSCPPILALLDFASTFTIEYDTSTTTIWAVLMQQGRPIVYFSQALK